MVESGWDVGDKPKVDAFSWDTMVNNVQRHIKGINISLKKMLLSQGIQYMNALAKIKGPHTVEYTLKSGKVMIKTAKHIVLATGGRPNMDSFPGCKENCVSSDDLFSMQHKPGKTCIIGASYIALECGGFVHGMGFQVDIMVRSILLRGFDQDIADKIGD